MADDVIPADVTAPDRTDAQHGREDEPVEMQPRTGPHRDVALRVQEAHLPRTLPLLPEIDVAGCQVAAADARNAGGDWFDVIPLPDGTVAFVVGDLPGHGVTASAAMGRLRAVLAEWLLSTDFADALRRVDRAAGRTRATRGATLCAVVLDPAGGQLRYATCGHPEPLILTPAGSVRPLARTGGAPLGVTDSGPPVQDGRLRRGELMLLYTDGLLRRPGRRLHEGRELMARTAADALTDRWAGADVPTRAVDRVCRGTVATLGSGGYDDGTALAVQWRTQRRQRWQAQVTAADVIAASYRDGLRAWLEDLGAAEHQRQAVELVVEELLVNAVEHAHPDGGGDGAEVSAGLDDQGVLTVRVSDHGTWRARRAPSATSGRGLWMVQEMAQSLSVERGGDASRGEPEPGTTVTARLPLHVPVVLVHGTGRDGASADGTRPFSARFQDLPRRSVVVTGPVDSGSAAVFRARIAEAGRGGLYPLTVDLSAVELLGSAGVRVLFEMRDAFAAHGTRLSLLASPGPARDVLELVGLDGLIADRP